MTGLWQPGQLLFVGFEGHRAPPWLETLIAHGRIGGVILFARNVTTPRGLAELVAQLCACAPEDAPLQVGIDQEGGRVQRLRDPWTQWPPMRRVGELDDLASTEAMARAVAVELAALGIGLNFAPVVDVDSNPNNPVIGDRSFAREPLRVARHASAFISAFQGQGIAACAKHFPGHGDTLLDSHLALPRLSHGLERLRRIELQPFAAAAASGVASMMSAHVVFEAVDPRRPATLSPAVTELLREELGYDGLLFSDDLEMKALADHYTPRDMTEQAIAAGVDSMMVCRNHDFALEVLARLESLGDAQVERAITRMVAFKRAFARPQPSPESELPPYAEHRALADRLTRGIPISGSESGSGSG